MGAIYFIGGIVFAGLVIDLISKAFGEDKVDNYDYHFAVGVGAVFNPTK